MPDDAYEVTGIAEHKGLQARESLYVVETVYRCVARTLCARELWRSASHDYVECSICKGGTFK